MSRNPRVGPGWVGGHSGRTRTGRGLLGRTGTGRGTLKEVWDRLRDHRGFPGRVGGTSLSFGMGRRNFGDVRDGSGRSGTGRKTLGEVRDGSEGLSGRSGSIWGGPGRLWRFSGRTERVEEVRDGRETLGEVRDRS